MNLIQVGCLLMTPEQLKRALDEDMTVSQARKMIEEDMKRAQERERALSPLVSDVKDNLTVTTRDCEDAER